MFIKNYYILHEFIDCYYALEIKIFLEFDIKNVVNNLAKIHFSIFTVKIYFIVFPSGIFYDSL